MIIFDTETSGLPLHPSAPLSKQPKIIELGLMLLDPKTGAELDSYNQLIDPGEPISAEITKITGITQADVDGQPRFKDVVDDIARFFVRATTVVAHNLPFDKSLLMYDLARCGRSSSLWWPKKEMCTVSLYTPEWGRMPKLTELYAAKIGKPLEQSHRALDDCRALVEIILQERLHEIA